MGLFVSTVAADVPIPELGLLLVHPTGDYDLGSQFQGEDIKRAQSLYDAIIAGNLTWAKDVGMPLAGADFDLDVLDIQRDNTGTGAHGDQVPIFSDLLRDKSGKVAFGAFAGSPRRAAVTFSVPFPDSSYSVSITGSDGRAWIVEDQLGTGFTINSQARALLTGPVQWTAIYNGESN